MQTQDQLFKEWNDEQRSAQAMTDLVAWYQTPRRDIAQLADSHPDAFELCKARLDEHLESEKRKGEHHLVSERYEHERTNKVNILLHSGKWRIANIAAPIGCSHFTETIDASPVNVKSEKTKTNFWAVVERV